MLTMAKGQSVLGALFKFVLVPIAGIGVGYTLVAPIFNGKHEPMTDPDATVATDVSPSATGTTATTAGQTPDSNDPSLLNSGPDVTVDVRPAKPAERPKPRHRHKPKPKPAATPTDKSIPDKPEPTPTETGGTDGTGSDGGTTTDTGGATGTSSTGETTTG